MTVVMGRSGSRHSRNAGTMGAEAQTYMERRRLGYGTASERLGSDSVVNYDACWLTLQPARDPVVTPEGYIYSREAILENLLMQKKAIRREMSKYEDAEKSKIMEQQQQSERDGLRAIDKFDSVNHAPLVGSGSNEAKNSAGKMTEYENFLQRENKSFWLPSKTPEAEKVVLKPKTETICPSSNKKLRLKDLVSVKFTPSPSAEDIDNTSERSGRHICPLSMKTLTKTSKLLVVKPTGDVITEEAYKTVIKPEGEYKGHKVTPKDVIRVKGGGSGFAGSHAAVQANKFFHLGPHNGPADLRGQTRAGGESAFGLRLHN